MSNDNNTLAKLELAQIGWVVPDIYAAVKFFSNTLGITSFPEPSRYDAEELGISYYGEVVFAEGLTSQTYHGGTFIELIQPVSGKSIFQDYLDKYPAGGTQHMAFRAPVSEFERITNELKEQGYEVMSTVDHPVARMMFFDTYATLGVATEIMGITPEGWTAIEQWKKSV